MKRRTFVRNASIVAAAVGVFGNIKWVNGKAEGDTPTTTDILGPFYRPGAPMRTNINPPDFKGTPLNFSGIVYRDDGKTPFKNCLVEVWQCNSEGHYDNTSDDYVYRGAVKTGDDGAYHFITTKPIPYPTNDEKTKYRPAHIHMRIAGEQGDQDLITQVYFKGDSHIPEDASSSSPLSVNRILDITKNSKNEDVVMFNVVMQKAFPLDDASFNKLLGVYDAGKDDRMEFFREGNVLFFKYNGQIYEGLYYKGNNTFENQMGQSAAQFELQANGETKVKLSYLDDDNKTVTQEATMLVKYGE